MLPCPVQPTLTHRISFGFYLSNVASWRLVRRDDGRCGTIVKLLTMLTKQIPR